MKYAGENKLAWNINEAGVNSIGSPGIINGVIAPFVPMKNLNICIWAWACIWAKSVKKAIVNITALFIHEYEWPMLPYQLINDEFSKRLILAIYYYIYRVRCIIFKTRKWSLINKYQKRSAQLLTI